jgi:AraC family transcriptional regulator of adaptative response / DNA-3-methyladenine glycosylase II
LQVAATRRLLFAKQLLGETALGMTDIALAAGYGSVRRFNATFSAAYGMAPRDVRRGRPLAPAGELELRLPYRPPYDLAGLLAFFERRAVPGVEMVDATSYRRAFVLRGSPGTLEVRALADEPALLLRVRHAHVQALPEIVTRVRRQFDLDADPATIAGVLRRDRQLAPLLRRFPGVRVPGCWDGFEIAVRAVLGQQVSVAVARTFAARLVQRWGVAFELADGTAATAFPTPEVLADADLTAIGVTRSRAQTIRTVARAVADGRVTFRPEQGLDTFVEAWTQLPGIGAWTAHYIAMRALGHPDAFPAADLILRKVAGGGVAVPTRELELRSRQWRPWRSYVTLLLWRASG